VNGVRAGKWGQFTELLFGDHLEWQMVANGDSLLNFFLGIILGAKFKEK
jgi:hypothetical protein